MNNAVFHPLGQAFAVNDAFSARADLDPRLTRSHYFDGRLLKAEDLARDQYYLDQRLRETGRALGHGVMHGLDIAFDAGSGQLKLSPGAGMTAAGRVLNLHRELQIDLTDRVRIAAQNKGRNLRFNRGLYAIVLQYAELTEGVAEVFPRDLGDRKDTAFNVYRDGIQLGMVPLRVGLAQQHPLHVRAQLMRDFLHGSEQYLPEDALALGVLAVRGDRPEWFDGELLRQPLRAELHPGDLQSDLHRQYQKLFADVMAYRAAGSLDGDFAASDYFSLLPPVGSLPKAAIDPEGGRQGFFPEDYPVWVAPVRKGDLELIRQEALQLPAIDLSAEEPHEIVVLAPLNARDYSYFARRLEREPGEGERQFPQLDLLRLRLYPRRPVHHLDTDRSSWQAIWDRVAEDELLFIRRPLRTAETGISGIVIARGTSLPPVDSTDAIDSTGGTDTTEGTDSTGGSESPADNGGLVQDENAVFLNRVNYKTLFRLRGHEDGEDSASALQEEFGKEADIVQASMNLLTIIERRYNPVVWQSLLELAQNKAQGEYLKALLEDEELNTAEFAVKRGEEFGLSDETREGWEKLSEEA